LASPAVSVTIVLHNSADFLLECLAALRNDVRSGLAEIIAVDNASPDDSPEIVVREIPEATLLRCSTNLGFAGGCNRAWPHTRGRYWMLLNPDVVLPTGALRRLVAWMEARPGLGLGTPEIVDAAGHSSATARRFPSIWLSLLELSRIHLLIPRRVRARMFLGRYVSSRGHELEADWVPAAALLARREAIATAGLLPEEFFMYGEDVLWCWRIKQAGWAVAVNGDVRALHREGGSALRTWGNREALRRRVTGGYLACRAIRGSAYAWIHAGICATAMALEANHPGRCQETRQRAREMVSVYLQLLRGAEDRLAR